MRFVIRLAVGLFVAWLIVQITWAVVGPTTKARFCALPFAPCNVLP